MRRTTFLSLAIGLLGFCASALMQAELLSQALLFFPASTQSLEYENLAQLRRLPNYAKLRQQYSGSSLDRAEATFSKLGITEDKMEEAVSTIGSADLYGIVSGSFSGIEAAKRAAKTGFRQLSLGDKHVFCSDIEVCVLFLEDSVAAFGKVNDLKAILQARQGITQRLGGKTPISELLAKADLHAPVIGVAPGSELNSFIGDDIPSGYLSKANLSKLLATISLFQYSVRLDDKAHLNMNLSCATSLEAAALSQSLSTLNALHSISASENTASFDHLAASSNEKLVHLTMDVSLR
jgi:hypothetical protein